MLNNNEEIEILIDSSDEDIYKELIEGNIPKWILTFAGIPISNILYMDSHFYLIYQRRTNEES